MIIKMKKTIIITFLTLVASVGFGQTKTDTLKVDTSNIPSKFVLPIASTGSYSTNLSISSSGYLTSHVYPILYTIAGKTIFWTSYPNQKTGRTVLHLHKSQIKWVNDTTAIIMPYKKPKHK